MGTFQAIGTIGGFALGGPQGAQIGSTIGALIDASQRKPPPVGDARFSSASYGTSIPRVHGEGRVSCFLFWAARNSDGTYLTETSGGGKGKAGQGGSHYSASFAFGIAQTGFTFPDGTQVERPLVIDRLWMNDMVVWQSATAAPISTYAGGTTYAYGDYVTGSDNNIYYSVADDNHGNDPTAQPSIWWQLASTTNNLSNLTIHPEDGESTFLQAVDSYIASVDGVPNTTAYRGLTYAVVQEMDLYLLGNQIPMRIEAEVHCETSVPLWASALAWSSLTTYTYRDYALDTGSGAYYRCSAYASLNNNPVGATGWMDWVKVGTILSSDFLSDVSRECSMTPADFDYSAANTTLTGHTQDQRQTGQSLVTPLITVKTWDAGEIDGKVKVLPRGGDPVVTIPDDHLSASRDISKLPDRWKAVLLADQTELHSSVEVKGRCTQERFRVGGEMAIRNTAPHKNPTSIETGLSMTRLEMAQAAGYLLDVEWTENGGVYEAVLPMDYGYLADADVILANDNDGVLKRWRIIEVDFEQGPIVIRVVRDAKENLTRYEAGSTATAVVVPPRQIIPTAFAVASPSVDIADAFAEYPGFYFWANGPGYRDTSNSTVYTWKSCEVWYTADAPGGTRNWVGPFEVSVRSAFGVTATHNLDSASGSGLDSTSLTHVILAFRGGGMTITSITQAQGAAGANWGLCGNEWISVLTIHPESLGYQLGPGLLRELRSTAGNGHSLGEQFAMAPNVSQTTKIKVDASLIGQTVYVRAFSPGQTLADSVEKTVVIAGPTSPYVTNPAPVDPSAVAVSQTNYNGQTEELTYRATVTGAPGGQRYNWQSSIDAGGTWSSSVVGDLTYSPPGFTTGTMRVRVQAFVPDGRVGAWVSSTDTTYAVPVTPQASPVDPDGITISNPTWSGSTESLTFTPLWSSSAPVAGESYQWQWSTDGATWEGPDGTSATYYAGSSFTKTFTAGSLYARVRGVTNAGVGAWVATSAQAFSAAPVVTSGWQKDTFTGDGATTAFTLSSTPISGAEFVFVATVLQSGGGVDYTVSGTTLTFGTAPDSGAAIIVRYPH